MSEESPRPALDRVRDPSFEKSKRADSLPSKSGDVDMERPLQERPVFRGQIPAFCCFGIARSEILRKRRENTCATAAKSRFHPLLRIERRSSLVKMVAFSNTKLITKRENKLKPESNAHVW